MQFLDVVVWGAFLAFVVALLALDLGVFHRQIRAIRSGEALAWAGFYISLALAFNLLVYLLYERNLLGVGIEVGHPLDGRTAALQFLTGFLLEKSLSLDNVFVIALIFAYFRVPLAYQHRVLFWGILGALLMRGAMIALGAALISRFDWIVYVFGGILIVTAARMLLAGDEEPEPEKNVLIRVARRFFPVTPELHGEHFFVRVGGRRAATPLFLVLLMVESTDVLFAVDSIPAIFAVTQDPFLVFTSNVFAILGLRSLYFAIAPLLGRFKYLKQSLVFILAFVGVKMLLAHTVPIPTITSLSVIVSFLAIGVLASALSAAREVAPLASPLATDFETLSKVTLQTARKIIVLAVGSTLILLGAAMIVLPGPATVVIPLGLAVLGTEFVWARRLLNRLREEVLSVANGRFGLGIGTTASAEAPGAAASEADRKSAP
ncbi:MAG: tellurium resistance protein TerC [Proteobacteria bacterium]|nr:MAG: tellurium resistance protein TerC [Pseudomonadota bacterium]